MSVISVDACGVTIDNLQFIRKWLLSMHSHVCCRLTPGHGVVMNSESSVKWKKIS